MFCVGYNFFFFFLILLPAMVDLYSYQAFSQYIHVILIVEVVDIFVDSLYSADLYIFRCYDFGSNVFSGMFAPSLIRNSKLASNSSCFTSSFPSVSISNSISAIDTFTSSDAGASSSTHPLLLSFPLLVKCQRMPYFSSLKLLYSRAVDKTMRSTQ